jgi:hypothetical protein
MQASGWWPTRYTVSADISPIPDKGTLDNRRAGSSHFQGIAQDPLARIKLRTEEPIAFTHARPQSGLGTKEQLHVADA